MIWKILLCCFPLDWFEGLVYNNKFQVMLFLENRVMEQKNNKLLHSLKKQKEGILGNLKSFGFVLLGQLWGEKRVQMFFGWVLASLLRTQTWSLIKWVLCSLPWTARARQRSGAGCKRRAINSSPAYLHGVFHVVLTHCIITVEDTRCELDFGWCTRGQLHP